VARRAPELEEYVDHLYCQTREWIDEHRFTSGFDEEDGEDAPRSSTNH
jgi:hypothetical protein